MQLHRSRSVVLDLNINALSCDHQYDIITDFLHIIADIVEDFVIRSGAGPIVSYLVVRQSTYD